VKSTPDQIKERFDSEVERFSNLESGQSATIDAPLVMELICQVASAASPGAHSALDVGCGAGNYMLKLLQQRPGLDITLLDLSRPMLDRAREQVGAAASGRITAIQGDIRSVTLSPRSFDIIIAAAVLHHLRTDEEWDSVFRKLFAALRPGGSLWISDLIQQNHPAIQALMWERYGEYLAGLRGERYRNEVFEYIEREDTPRSLFYQVDRMRAAGFTGIEILHKNSVFAAFGGIAPGPEST
jgi:tRNA (cmo5U34)-methyltransferase